MADQGNERRTGTGDVESLLSDLTPTPPRGSRDRLMYAAGEDAGRRSAVTVPPRFLQAAVLLLGCSTLWLAVTALRHPGRTVIVERVIEADDAEADPSESDRDPKVLHGDVLGGGRSGSGGQR